MSENKRQPTAESHQSVNVNVSQTYKRSFTRKNPQTGKSNYPTLINHRQITIQYENGKKIINNSNYRKIQ